MKYTELMEGAEPKLPGAPKGIQIMTPQQFVTKSAGEEEKLDELSPETLASYKKKAGMEASKLDKQAFANDVFAKQKIEKANKRFSGIVRATNKELSKSQKGVTEGFPYDVDHMPGPVIRNADMITDNVKVTNKKDWVRAVNSINAQVFDDMSEFRSDNKGETVTGNSAVWAKWDNATQTGWFNAKGRPLKPWPVKKQGVAEGSEDHNAIIYDNGYVKIDGKMYKAKQMNHESGMGIAIQTPNKMYFSPIENEYEMPSVTIHRALRLGGLKPTFNEGVAEATKLAAPTRPFGDQELTDYLDRIRKQEKAKTDKYKLPYIHRSSVMGYYNEEGQKYNVDAIKSALAQKPKSLLKKNEKMKHSDGELEQFFNIGFAALVGVALDENTNEIIIVNTCPGAGSCKIDCFAMKGGKIQFQGPWLSDGRILTYLLNDPTGFFTQLKNEITKEYNKGKKEGYSVSIRWHDAGDFFSPEYASMAFKLAEELPNVNFYAYTKVADVAVGKNPSNFMINWSEGASTAQEKKVKQLDPNLEQTKNSRIVPNNLFYDLLVKDEKKNLVKGPEGQWQVIPDKIPELKDRLSKAYNISKNSILTYSEYESKVKGKDKSPLKYNVIITPGEPDVTAKDPGVLSTLLLKH